MLIYFSVNFWPAITGAAVVDLELALPHPAQAIESNQYSYVVIYFNEIRTIRLVCALLAVCFALINLGFACGTGARVCSVWISRRF